MGSASLQLPPLLAPASPPHLKMSLAAMEEKIVPSSQKLVGWVMALTYSEVVKGVETLGNRNIFSFDVDFMNASLGMTFYKWLTQDLLQSYSVADEFLCL